MTTILFLGGWLPIVDVVLPRISSPAPYGLVRAEDRVLPVRVHVGCCAKAFVPRYRYDQLMRLGWKVSSCRCRSPCRCDRCRCAGHVQGGFRGKADSPKDHELADLHEVARWPVFPLSVNSLFLKEFVGAYLSVPCSATSSNRSATLNYPYEKGPAQPTVSRRACTSAVSERRRALHRLQAVRGDLPRTSNYHRSRTSPQ